MQMDTGRTEIWWISSLWLKCYTKFCTEIAFIFFLWQLSESSSISTRCFHRLNLSDGRTTVQHIRSGWFEKRGIIIKQDMQYEDFSKHADNSLIQKRIRRILKERSLWPDSGLPSDDARNLLQSQPDFLVAAGNYLQQGVPFRHVPQDSSGG